MQNGKEHARRAAVYIALLVTFPDNILYAASFSLLIYIFLKHSPGLSATSDHMDEVGKRL